MGSPENPLSFDQLEEKFRGCASYSLKTLSERDLDEIISTVKNLEEVKDVSKIMEMIT